MTRHLRQVDAILEHALERLACLRKLANGTQAELALYNHMYNTEDRVAGAAGAPNSGLIRCKRSGALPASNRGGLPTRVSASRFSLLTPTPVRTFIPFTLPCVRTCGFSGIVPP